MKDKKDTPPSAADADEQPAAPATTDAPTQPATPDAKRKTAEQWAIEKGLVVLGKDGQPDLAKRTPWELACARQHAGWGIGRELTEAEFDAAITTVTNLTQG